MSESHTKPAKCGAPDADHNAEAPPAAMSTSTAHVSQTLDFLDTTFAKFPTCAFAFRLWDGTVWRRADCDRAVPPPFTIVLNHSAALRQMFLPPSDSTLALAYTFADFDIEGDEASALALGEKLWSVWSFWDTLYAAYQLLRLPRRPTVDSVSPQLSGGVHSLQRDVSAIQFHYDVSNDFYKLWLDDRMVYSCGYFGSVSDSIHAAQVRKLDFICRKLRLRKGDRLLDVGCGWGALIIHACKHFGVTALGVTLSEKQAQFAQARIEAEGLTSVCTVELKDYRNVTEGPFDKVVSVGMVEHVGRENLSTYFGHMFSLLKAGGVFLNHGITLLHEPFKSRRETRHGFFAKYIFPDGDVQPIGYVLERATGVGFEIRDVECLREHYAATLKCWRERFDSARDKIVALVGLQTFRLWRLYLLAAGWGFHVGHHSIYQTVLFKAADSRSALDHLPLTRDDWYAESLRNAQ